MKSGRHEQRSEISKGRQRPTEAAIYQAPYIKSMFIFFYLPCTLFTCFLKSVMQTSAKFQLYDHLRVKIFLPHCLFVDEIDELLT